MRNLLFILFCVGTLYVWAKAVGNHSYRQRLQLGNIKVPRFAHIIPGDEYNYRSAQPGLTDLDTLLNTGLLTTVIRLNGDGNDAAGIPVSEEQILCEAYHVAFYRINAHQPGAAAIVHELLRRGRTLIHCQYGFDCTGAMVGYHLRRIGYTREQALQHNGWKDYIKTKKGAQYEKYLVDIK